MKNIKKAGILVIVICMLLSIAACAATTQTSQTQATTTSLTTTATTSAATTTEAARKNIIVTVKTQQHAYHQAMAKQWKLLAEQNGFDVTIMDPNFDNTKLEKIVEDIIALNPDGVAFCPVDTNLAGAMIQKIIDAGIPVVAYDSRPNDLSCPTIVGDNYQGGLLAGEESAKLWKQVHPDVAPVVGIVGLVGIKEVDDRMNGFTDGFKKIYKDMVVTANVNGSGVREKSLKAAEDMLQANPEINVIFGINDDSALGALDALKEIGRNTIDKALVSGIDGSEAAMNEVKDPNSALRVDIGYPSKAFADATWDALQKVMDGSLAGNKDLVQVPLQFIDPMKIDEWLSINYPK